MVEQKTFLYVPYEEKDEAKTLGARWDQEQKSWYVPSGVDLDKFAKWLDPKEPNKAEKLNIIYNPDEAEEMTKNGFTVKPNHIWTDSEGNKRPVYEKKVGDIVLSLYNGIREVSFPDGKFVELHPDGNFVASQGITELKNSSNGGFEVSKEDVVRYVTEQFRKANESFTA